MSIQMASGNTSMESLVSTESSVSTLSEKVNVQIGYPAPKSKTQPWKQWLDMEANDNDANGSKKKGLVSTAGHYEWGTKGLGGY